MTEQTVSQDITWRQMTDAGVDINYVKRIDQRVEAATFEAVSPDRERQIAFGLQPDPGHELADGEHPGWASTEYERDTDMEWADVQTYWYKPESVDRLLAEVAAVMRGDRGPGGDQ